MRASRTERWFADYRATPRCAVPQTLPGAVRMQELLGTSTVKDGISERRVVKPGVRSSCL